MTENPPNPQFHTPSGRCHFMTPKGRQCRSLILEPGAAFCPRHYMAQPNGPGDFALQLVQRASGFQNAQGINNSLSTLYVLLASDVISPRRAAVLAYISSLLLRTLPAIDTDPHPLAGRDRNARVVHAMPPSKNCPLHNPPLPVTAHAHSPDSAVLAAEYQSGEALTATTAEQHDPAN